MDLIQILTETLKHWSLVLPLPWFAFIGAFVEELTPVPTSIVMTILGSLSATKGQGFILLFLLSLIAATGKEIAYYLEYLLGDKAEDVLINKFGRFFGIKKEQVESIGKQLNKGSRDNLVVFILRAMPVIPTMLVSLACGVIKVNFKTYMISSFIGTLVRNMIYLYLGFSGVQILNSIKNNSQNNQIGMWIILGVIILIGLLSLIFGKKIKSKFGLK